MIRRIALLAGLYALLGGLASLAGWVLDLPRLTDWDGNGISIQPNATLCVISSGAGLLALATGRTRLAAVGGAAVLLVSGLTLVQWVGGLSFGIDTLLLFGRAWGRGGVVFPGRMGPPGCLAWALLGVALLLSAAPPRLCRWAPALALVTAGVSALSLVGYLYGVEELYALPHLSIIALQTSSFIMAVSLGVIVSHPEREPLRMFLDAGGAGVLARRALPLLLVVPVALGYFRVKGQEAGLYDTAPGTAVFTLVLVGFLAGLMAWVLHAVRVREQALARESRQRQLITDAVPALISYVDAQGCYRFNNKAYQDWFGHAPEELHGRHLREVLGAEAFERLRPHVEAVLAGQRLEFEGEIPYREGGPRHVHAEYVPDIQPDGTVAGYFALVSDISERKQAEAALRASEAREHERAALLQTILDTSPSPIWVALDPRCERLVGNPAGDALLGAPRGANVALNAAQDERYQYRCLRDGADVPAAMLPMQRAARDGVAVSAEEYEVVRGDGTRVWLLMHASPLVQGGRVAGAVAVAVDITRRKLAEEALRESEALFRTLGEAVPDFLWMADLEGRPIYQNPAWRRYVGLTHEELAARGWEVILHPDEVPTLRRVWADAVATGEAFQVEARTRRQDGVYRWFAGRTVPLKDAAGRVVKWVGTMTDVHDRKTAEEALREADRRKDEFLAMLAHELRNPLVPIRNALQVLHLQESDSPQVQWARELIDRQVRQLTRLIDDLLDVNRISRGTVALRRARVTLAEVVQAAVETSRPLVEKCGHELAVDLPSQAVYLDADPTRLAQVFANLLNNAAKYTERGGAIRLTAERHGGEVVVSVKDSGIGIPREKLQSVFELFAQVPGALDRAQGGLGIGLSLVKRFVEMHGGTVEARSQGPGTGSEFVVRLPVVD